MAKQIRVALVGLGFGKFFAPVYKLHPLSKLEALCAVKPIPLNEAADALGVEKRYTDFDEMLKDPDIDAVHLVTPCETHSPMAVAAMKAGKHVACTVPVGWDMEEIARVVRAQRETGMTYMMMETAVYTREYLHIQGLRDSGKLGKIQFVRGSHLQDMGMPGWPDYWKGLPPMWYATHCIGPCLEIAGGLAESVSCLGSGRIREDYIPIYGSPYSFETAHVKFKDSDVAAEITRFVHGATRQYCETLDIYGSQTSVEWRRADGGEMFLFDGGENVKMFAPPDNIDGLPAEVADLARSDMPIDKSHNSFAQGGGHGGSYPHLVNEFLCAINECRKPSVDIVKAANWSAVGFLAHQSAMEKGREIAVPDYGGGF